jgi:16S rRNA (adenine1518-N6/adenine1519-N6)-dimethyltransferase
MPRQRLGQHFLADAGWREKIARAIHISPHMTLPARPSSEHCWIEVGAGHGEMTRHLLASGAPVYAIELDAPLAQRLQTLEQQFSNLTVIRGDVLETDLTALAGDRRIHLYGNLPYYITSPILHHFFKFAASIDEIHVVIQLEVAFRLTARTRTRDYGYLSVLTQFFSNPTLVLKIPPGAFRPPPKVASALVTMKLPGKSAHLFVGGSERFLGFVKLCFSQKRKTLANNLRSLANRKQVQAALAALGQKAESRAEELGVEQLASLYLALSDQYGARVRKP